MRRRAAPVCAAVRGVRWSLTHAVARLRWRRRTWCLLLRSRLRLRRPVRRYAVARPVAPRTERTRPPLLRRLRSLRCLLRRRRLLRPERILLRVPLVRLLAPRVTPRLRTRITVVLGPLRPWRRLLPRLVVWRWCARQVRRLRDVRLLRHRAALVRPWCVRQRRRRVEAQPRTAGATVPPGVVVVVRAAVLLGCPILRSGPVRRRQLLVVTRGTGRQEVVNHAFIVPPLRRVSATACG